MEESWLKQCDNTSAGKETAAQCNEYVTLIHTVLFSVNDNHTTSLHNNLLLITTAYYYLSTLI